MGKILRKAKTFFHTPNILTKKLSNSPFLKIFPDKMALKIRYKAVFGKKLNLKNPQTFNEKLQWLKLYNRKPEYTIMVDKYAVKKYVSDILGEEYIIPTLGVWEKFDDIDFDALPDRFVLKTTHGSGDIVICKDKANFDKIKAKEKLTKALKTNYYKIAREWPYKNVPRRIIAESYMEDVSGTLKDYKFFCFDGEAKFMFVATDRSIDCRFDFFDMGFNHLDVINLHPLAEKSIEKPDHFEEMKHIAEVLSKGLAHVRIDLYEINGKIYFGEYTFFHASGFSVFKPKEFDYLFGGYLNLPEKYKGD